jgi:hypothetical protein
MLMMFMSLALTILPMQPHFLFAQQASGSNQTVQKVPAQQDKKDSTNTTYVLNQPRTVSVTPIPLPAGDNAWAIQIVSSGGITGTGRGNVTLTSDGVLMRFGADGSCTRKLPAETIQSLSKTVFAAIKTNNSDGPLDRLICPDCIVTAMVVQRREAAGDEITLTAFWHDASEAKVAVDLLNIYQTVIANRDCRLQ